MKPIEPLTCKRIYVLIKLDPITANSIWLVNTTTAANHWETLESAQRQQLLEKIKGFDYQVFELDFPV